MQDDNEGLTEKGKEALVATARKVRSYAVHASSLAKVLSLASTIMPGGAVIAATLEGMAKTAERFSEAAASLPADEPLTAQKQRLEESLATLPAPLIVFVDDLERLEPAETLEMVRLIRAVGDLPNIIYVLCYDRKVLVANLENVLAVKNGDRYLEKVVQVTLPLPQPESFTLRDWFYDEALKISGLREGENDDAEAIRRLNKVVMEEGGIALTTPRDVLRALNALKLYWPPIQAYVDFSDLVWVQLVRLKSPRLYNWVVNYVTQFADVARFGANVHGTERSMRELKSLLRKRPSGFKSEFFRLSAIVPGLYLTTNPKTKKQEPRGYTFDHHTLAELARRARLGSPHYFRYYFAFGPAAGELHESGVSEIIGQLKSDDAAFQASMQRLAETKTPHGVQLASLVDRLTAISDSFDEIQAKAVLAAMSNCMDAAHLHDSESFGVTRVWEAGERLWRAALGAVRKENIGLVLRSAAEEGQALGWIARRLSFDLYTAQREQSTHWSVDDVKLAVSRFLHRVARLGLEIKASAHLAEILHLWCLTDGVDVVRKHAGPLFQDDEFFLRFLHSARGWVGADRVYRPLRAADLQDLLDQKSARTRVQEMQETLGAYPQHLRSMIVEVETALDEADQLRR